MRGDLYNPTSKIKNKGSHPFTQDIFIWSQRYHIFIWSQWYPISFCVTELPDVASGASGASTLGAIVGVLLTALLLIVAVVVTAIVSYTLYMKRSEPRLLLCVINPDDSDTYFTI